MSIFDAIGGWFDRWWNHVDADPPAPVQLVEDEEDEVEGPRSSSTSSFRARKHKAQFQIEGQNGGAQLLRSSLKNSPSRRESIVQFGPAISINSTPSPMLGAFRAGSETNDALRRSDSKRPQGRTPGVESIGRSSHHSASSVVGLPGILTGYEQNELGGDLLKSQLFMVNYFVWRERLMEEGLDAVLNDIRRGPAGDRRYEVLTRFMRTDPGNARSSFKDEVIESRVSLGDIHFLRCKLVDQDLQRLSLWHVAIRLTEMALCGTTRPLRPYVAWAYDMVREDYASARPTTERQLEFLPVSTDVNAELVHPDNYYATWEDMEPGPVRQRRLSIASTPSSQQLSIPRTRTPSTDSNLIEEWDPDMRMLTGRHRYPPIRNLRSSPVFEVPSPDFEITGELSTPVGNLRSIPSPQFEIPSPDFEITGELSTPIRNPGSFASLDFEINGGPSSPARNLRSTRSPSVAIKRSLSTPTRSPRSNHSTSAKGAPKQTRKRKTASIIDVDAEYMYKKEELGDDERSPYLGKHAKRPRRLADPSYRPGRSPPPNVEDVSPILIVRRQKKTPDRTYKPESIAGSIEERTPPKKKQRKPPARRVSRSSNPSPQPSVGSRGQSKPRMFVISRKQKRAEISKAANRRNVSKASPARSSVSRGRRSRRQASLAAEETIHEITSAGKRKK